MSRSPEPRGSRWRARGPRCALAAMISVAALLVTVPSAGADAPWNDGTWVQSSLVKCVINVEEVGAIAAVGYQGDPANLPKAGEVFYGHAAFGAATEACGGDQAAELDLVLPAGVSLAVDASHPIRCTYTDQNAPTVPDPSCPTHAIAGTYGPQLAHDDAGDAWVLPPGRLFIIEFPLRSTRQLKGPAGGACPQTLTDVVTPAANDCLVGALHLADGYSDPWLLPDEPMVIGPASAPSPPAPSPPAPAPPVPVPPKPAPVGRKIVTRIEFSHTHLAKLANKRLTLSLHCAKRCHGTVTITVSAKTARRLRLAKQPRHPVTIAHGRFSARLAKSATVQLKVASQLAARLRRLSTLPVTVTAKPSDGPRTVAHRTLRR